MMANTFALAIDALISSPAMHTKTFSPTLEALTFLPQVLADAAADALAAGPNLPAVRTRHQKAAEAKLLRLLSLLRRRF